jgi:hypothetical protein
LRRAHFLPPETGAVRDEDERNVGKARGVLDVEEGAGKWEETPECRELAVAREGDVPHGIGLVLRV